MMTLWQRTPRRRATDGKEMTRAAAPHCSGGGGERGGEGNMRGGRERWRETDEMTGPVKALLSNAIPVPLLPFPKANKVKSPFTVKTPAMLRMGLRRGFETSPTSVPTTQIFFKPANLLNLFYFHCSRFLSTVGCSIQGESALVAEDIKGN